MSSFSHYCYVNVDDQTIELQFDTEHKPHVGRVFANWNSVLHDDTPFAVQDCCYSNPTYVLTFERDDGINKQTLVRFILEQDRLVCSLFEVYDGIEKQLLTDAIPLADMNGEDYVCEFNLQ